MLDLLRSLSKNGFRSSEFFVAVLALVLPILDKIVNAGLAHLGALQQASAPTSPLASALYGLAVAVIAAAYAYGRSLVKRDGMKTISLTPLPEGASAGFIRADPEAGAVDYADGATTPSGNVVSAGSGNPAVEEARRAAAAAR